MWLNEVDDTGAQSSVFLWQHMLADARDAQPNMLKSSAAFADKVAQMLVTGFEQIVSLGIDLKLLNALWKRFDDSVDVTLSEPELIQATGVHLTKGNVEKERLELFKRGGTSVLPGDDLVNATKLRIRCGVRLM